MSRNIYTQTQLLIVNLYLASFPKEGVNFGF